MANQRYDLRLEFASFREFVEGFASRLSEEGMFVEQAESGVGGQPAVGQEVALEARVSSGFGLLKGRGEVAWSRAAGDAPAGFAVRFLQLDEPSRRLLTKVVESLRRDGGQVFDLMPPPPAAAPAPPISAEPPVDLAKTIATGKTLEDLLAEGPGGVPSVRAGVEAQLLDALPEPVPPGGVVPPAAPNDQPDSTTEILSGPSDEEAADIPPTISEAMAAGWPPPAEEAAEDDALVGTAAVGGGRRGLWRFVAVTLLAAAAGLAFYQYRELLLGWLPGGAERSATATTPPVAPTPGPDPEGRPRAALQTGEDRVSGAAPAAAGSGATAGTALPPPAPPAAAPRPSPPGQRGEAPALDGPFTRLDSVTWSESAGETAIVLTADGPIRPGKFGVLPISSGEPRVLVKLAGVEQPFPGGGVTVGSSHVRRVRTGLHTVDEGREIHVVMDLVDAAVVVDRVEPERNQLVVVFVRR